MKNYTSMGSYIEESVGRGRIKVFIVENDQDRNSANPAAYNDLIGAPVLIDGLEYTVMDIRDSRRGQTTIRYKSGELIGLEVK
jgi:hypothetical protein